MKTKICTKCNKEKDISEFYIDSYQKNGFRPDCKLCKNIPSQRIIDQNNLVFEGLKKCVSCNKIKLLSEFHKHLSGIGKTISECKLCRKENRKYDKEYQNQYYLKNKERIKIYKHDSKNKQRRNQLLKERYNNDTAFKILWNLRRRICLALNGKDKSLSTIFLIGCEIDYLIYHIQEQFTEGMNWDNYGKGIGKWNIDHILPCISFDLSKESEQRKCFNYSNLQPLWAIDNLRKGIKIL